MKLKGFERLLLYLVGTVFIVSLFAIFWSTLLDYKYWALGISAALLLLFSVIFDAFSWKKIIKGIKKRSG